MTKENSRNIRLGLFVLSGIFLLIISLYFIGSKRNMFDTTFKVYAIFQNVNGLKEGGNVRFSGIDVGTIERIDIINDTSIRVEMVIEDKLKNTIRKNALASIGTDGLMGNKLVNIDPVNEQAVLVKEGETLTSVKTVNTEVMLRTLEITNHNIALVSADLKNITDSLVSEQGTLYKILLDTSMGSALKNILQNVSTVGEDLSVMTNDLSSMVKNVKNGKGTMGLLLSDSSMAMDLSTTVENVKISSKKIVEVSESLNALVSRLNNEKGLLNTIGTDTAISNQLKQTIQNLQSGTDNFNQSMEALKHSFLLRGYFKKQESEQKKQLNKN